MVGEAIPWELGDPLTYKALGPDATPLCVATIWPEDLGDREAEMFVRRLETIGAAKIGALNPHSGQRP